MSFNFVTLHNFDVTATLLFWFLAFIWSRKGKTGAEFAFNFTLKFGFLALALAGSWLLILQHLGR